MVALTRNHRLIAGKPLACFCRLEALCHNATVGASGYGAGVLPTPGNVEAPEQASGLLEPVIQVKQSQINRHNFMIQDGWNRDGEHLSGRACSRNSPTDEELNLLGFLAFGKPHLDFL